MNTQSASAGAPPFDYLDEARVLALADPLDLVAQMADGFRALPPLPARMHYSLPGGDGAKLLIMPAWVEREAIGVKIATVIPLNPRAGRATINGLYMLLDGETGEPVAILSAPALTATRTAAVSALAASYLARRGAQTLLLIGTGALAPHLAIAHASVRSYERLMIWGRDAGKAQQLARQMKPYFPAVEVASDLPRAITEADVISAATASTVPIIEARWLRDGTHLDLVGSFAPNMRETDSLAIARSRLVIDTIEALSESGDLLSPLREGLLDAANVTTLDALVQDVGQQRRDEVEITAFKTVGTGYADILAARRLVALHRGATVESPATLTGHAVPPASVPATQPAQAGRDASE